MLSRLGLYFKYDLRLLLTRPPPGPAFDTGVRLMETDDEEKPVQRGLDHRRAE